MLELKEQGAVRGVGGKMLLTLAQGLGLERI